MREVFRNPALRVGWLIAAVIFAGCAEQPAAEQRAAEQPAAESPQAQTAALSDPERVVQAQFAAYNSRNLDAFLATLAPDVRLYAFPDSLLYAGRDTLRAVYGRLFQEAAGLRAVVLQRMVQGNFVIERETTYGLPGRGPLTGIAITEVKDGLVTRIWYVD